MNLELDETHASGRRSSPGTYKRSVHECNESQEKKDDHYSERTSFRQQNTDDAIDLHLALIPSPPVAYASTQNSALTDTSSTENIHRLHAANTFPPLAGADFTQLSSEPNYHLLSALRNLGMNEITNALQGIEASKNHFTTELSVAPHHGWIPANLVQHDSRPPSSPYNTVEDTLQREQHDNPDHAYMLANKWLTTSKLAKLTAEQGLVYKKGRFSNTEAMKISNAIAKYQEERGMTSEELRELIFSTEGQTKDTAFWSIITFAVPLRPIVAVYHYVRRKWHALNKKGAWSTAEDSILENAVVQLGTQWEKVGHKVGRMATDCRDRYRDYILGKEKRRAGLWSKEEEQELLNVMEKVALKYGGNPDNIAFWGRVSEMMDGTRGWRQCQTKWQVIKALNSGLKWEPESDNRVDSLSKIVKNNGKKPRWSRQDASILVLKVDSLGVRDDTEINWRTLSDPTWNLWSAHELQRRWVALKRSIEDSEQLTHPEIMHALKARLTQVSYFAQPVASSSNIAFTS